MAFLALIILGLALSPLLKVKLLPDRTLPSVTVYYSYGGASAVVVGGEVLRGWKTKTEVGRRKTEDRRRKILPKRSGLQTRFYARDKF